MWYDALNFFLSLDQHLTQLILTYVVWAYALLFLVIFCETGIVVFPFLPGDSLLFVAGSLSALSTCVLDIKYLSFLLVAASFLGNWTNYHIGHFIGKRVFQVKANWFWKPQYLIQAQQFYDRYGKWAIILARFLPIIRTFVPFVAGVVHMDRVTFLIYNFFSAMLWILSLLLFGYFFGKLSFVQLHLNMMIYGIIVLSLSPSVWMLIKKIVYNQDTSKC